MAYGRKTGGRKKGTPNKLTVERLAALPPEVRQFDALEQMVTQAKYWLGLMATEQSASRVENRAVDVALMSRCSEHAHAYLKDITPYQHPKLATTTLRTDPHQPLTTRLEVEFVGNGKAKGAANPF